MAPVMSQAHAGHVSTLPVRRAVGCDTCCNHNTYHLEMQLAWHIQPHLRTLPPDLRTAPTCSPLPALLLSLQVLDAKTIYTEHHGVVEDVAWHCHHQDIFGSVGDDKQLILWDMRRPPSQGGWRAALPAAATGPLLARPVSAGCHMPCCAQM